MKLAGTCLVLLCAMGLPVARSEPERNESTNPPANTQSDGRKIEPPPIDSDTSANFPGLHNVVTYAPGLLSGSVPEGKEGFDTLQAMGVRTVISVDGAAPAVDQAAAKGIRYVHLPIGYNGMDHRRTLEIAKALKVAQERDPGAPIYLHCHHGKHRSAGALGAAAVTLGYLNSDEAKARMQVSGTAANYAGLYQCVAAARPASREEIGAVKSDFPAIWKTSGLVKSMVEIDDHFEHLRIIEKAGWTSPKDHPDLVPAAEAGRLADLFRYLEDDERVKAKSAEFRAWLAESSRQAEAMEKGLIQRDRAPEEQSKLFKVITTSCKACHVKYRD